MNKFPTKLNSFGLHCLPCSPGRHEKHLTTNLTPIYYSEFFYSLSELYPLCSFTFFVNIHTRTVRGCTNRRGSWAHNDSHGTVCGSKIPKCSRNSLHLTIILWVGRGLFLVFQLHCCTFHMWWTCAVTAKQMRWQFCRQLDGCRRRLVCVVMGSCFWYKTFMITPCVVWSLIHVRHHNELVFWTMHHFPIAMNMYHAVDCPNSTYCSC